MSKELLKATHEGVLELGETSLNVAVLSDGTRIITQSAVFKAFGRTKRGRAKDDIRVLNRPAFLDANNLQPFVGNDLESVLKEIEYESINGALIEGFNSEILPMMCKVYLDAREDKKLLKQQLPLARASEILLLSLSKLGMIALVDEATGYQYEREKFELQKILVAYVNDEIAKWQLTFTVDFYKELFRLWKQPFNPSSIKKPSFVGTLTNKYVYEALPDGVFEAIKEKTPKTKGGNNRYRFHQSLTEDVGREHLKKQIIEVTALMSVCDTKEQFIEMFERKYNKKPTQLTIKFDDKSSEFNKSLKKAIDYTPKD